jgi:hypothetical protein
MTPSEIFHTQGYLHLKGLIDNSLCNFLSHILLRNPSYGGKTKDGQSESFSLMEHEVVFETLQEKLWPSIEQIIGEELLPTYSYSRLYVNGNTLEKHTDRPECEISVSIQLGRSHHYSWPIYMNGNRIDLAEGDGVLYKGCDVEHWRNVCDGPNGYYSGQVFIHFVRKNGSFADKANDPNIRNVVGELYNRYRTHLMDIK